MSSTFVADSTDDRKSDDTLITIVNADGTLSVDPDALNKLIANQHTAGVSVVRIGSGQHNEGAKDSTEGTGEDDNPHINLTVEGFYPPGSTTAITSNAAALASGTSVSVPVSATPIIAALPTSSVSVPMVSLASTSVPQAGSSAAGLISSSSTVTNVTPPVIDGGVQTGGGDLVDPFSEMDSEQLKRLETALQSEQAKQILGENVTAMFDMLNVNGEQGVPLHESIRMDHWYILNEMFTNECIAAQSFVFIAGGSATTSAALSFALFELASNPEVQARLQKEVENVLSTQEFDYNAIKDMKYMEQFLNEVLRLHPPGGVLGRVCTKEFILPGTNTVIEKGVIINIPVQAIHKDPQYFPDPETFNPDRFEDMNDIPKGVFMPFGAGPRICIALRLAMLEMKIYLARLVLKYNLTLSEKTQVPLKLATASFILNAVGGIWVTFEKRE